MSYPSILTHRTPYHYFLCFQARAQRRQTTYEDYEAFISNPTDDARKTLLAGSKNILREEEIASSNIGSDILNGNTKIDQRWSDQKEKDDSNTHLTDSTDSLSDAFSSSASDSDSDISFAEPLRAKVD